MYRTDNPVPVLLIDDDPSTAERIGELFESDGIAATLRRGREATIDPSGSTAVTEDIILLVLRTSSSWELLESLRAADAEVAIVAILPDFDHVDELAVMNAGADDVVGFDELDSRGFPRAIRNAWERSRLRKRLAYSEKRLAVSRATSLAAMSEDTAWRMRYHDQRLIEHAQDIIVVIDRDGRLRYASPSAKRVLGYEPGETIGRSCFEFIPEDDRTAVRNAIMAALRKPGASERVEHRFLRKDGSWCWLESVGTNMVDDESIGGLVINARDISEQKAVAEKLQRSEQYYRFLIEHALDIISIIEPDGTLRYSSPARARILGTDSAEVTGSSVLDRIHPDDHQVVLATLARERARQGAGGPVVYRMQHRDGDWRWLESIALNLIDEPIIGGFVVATRDVTERLRMEREREHLLEMVEQERARLDALVMNIPGMVWESSEPPDGGERRITLLSGHVESMLGYHVDELTREASSWMRLVHPDDRDRLARSGEELERTGQSQIHVRMIARDGRDVWIDLRTVAVRNSEGRMIGTRGVGFDITERITAERALRRNQRVFESFMNNTPAAAFIKDTQGRYEFVNDRFLKTFGGNRDQVVGRTDFDLWPLANAERIRTTDLEAYGGDGVLEFIASRPGADGEFTAHVIKFPLPDVFGERMLGGLVFDVTERERMQRSMRISEEKYRTIVETAHEGIWVVDFEGITTFVNARLAELLGCTVEGMQGRPLRDFVADEDWEQITLERESRKFGVSSHYEFRFRRADGTFMWTIVSATPFLDDEGKFTGSLGMITDITSKKEAEQALRRANDELEMRVQQRTAELRTTMKQLERAHEDQRRFVADASHDLRTPLTVVRAETDLLLGRQSLDPSIRASLAVVRGQVDRLNHLAEDLLALASLDARPSRLRSLHRVRLDELMMEIVVQLQSLAAAKSLHWNFDCEEAIEMTCDSSLIRRALMNVVENAVKYSHDDRPIEIRLTASEADALVEVTDYGPGIPPADIPKIFDRFFRGDSARSTPGTGLGLAIVQSVVEAHNGQISVTSVPARGTTFRIALPLSPTSP